VIVVDASVVGDALLLDGEAGAAAARALAADQTWAAPAHLTIEVLSVLRKHYLRWRLSATRAGEALGALQTLEFERVDICPLLDRIWELKENLSSYDAPPTSQQPSCGGFLCSPGTQGWRRRPGRDVRS
jgi:predicted nucleic acid-binding protein